MNYSIIIPFRDNLSVLYVALKSIPDRRDIQILIIDNSAESLESRFENCHSLCLVDYLMSDSTKGAGCARNVGLKNAVGKWLLFLDSDDFFMPGAFDFFDRHLEDDCDVVFFRITSCKLGTRNESERHYAYNRRVDKFITTKNENYLRQMLVTPYCKMIRRQMVVDNGIKFEEVKVSNDIMFSTVLGYKAKSIALDESVAYCVTEAEKGGSLTQMKTRENMFIRYLVAIERYKFLDSVGVKEARPSVLGYIVNAIKLFGLREGVRYYRTARKEKINPLMKYITKNILD